MNKLLYYIVAISAIIFFVGCNPFAPELADNESNASLLGDQTTIEGLFKNFKYAYSFKDTTIYGKLLSKDFVFIYRNYDKMADFSMSRDEDMNSTYNLFQAAQNLNIIWNDIISETGDSLLQDISRSFSLTITFSSSDIVQLAGNVNLRIKRDSVSQPWQIIQWRDESFY